MDAVEMIWPMDPAIYILYVERQIWRQRWTKIIGEDLRIGKLVRKVNGPNTSTSRQVEGLSGTLSRGEEKVSGAAASGSIRG